MHRLFMYVSRLIHAQTVFCTKTCLCMHRLFGHISRLMPLTDSNFTSVLPFYIVLLPLLLIIFISENRQNDLKSGKESLH